MKKKKIFYVLVVMLTLLEVTSVYFMFQSLNNKEVILDNVKLKDIANKNNSFAIMLNDGDGNYVESSSNEWPDNTLYNFNSSKSGCIDNDGKALENALSYDNSTKQATLSIGGTSYCYLYFDKILLAGEYLLDNPTTGLDTTTAYNGMYRYIGTTANNYVSLDGVLYRIIGITSDANSTLGLQANQLKLIKATSIGTYNWHSSYTTDTIWTSSAMYTYLQGSSVLSNTSIIPSGWSSKISSVKWNIGDVNTTTIPDASTVLGLEDNTVTTGSSKVGLMYLSDYYYANTAGGTTNCYTTASCSNWMTLGSQEWTMTRYGRNGSRYFAWYVSSGGDVYSISSSLTSSYAVRPVFYLAPTVTYEGGSGTEGDPIILGVGEDKEAPVINTTANDDGTMTITSSESGTYCVNTSATSTGSCTLSGDVVGDIALTTSALTSDGTYYVHVTDSVGNVGHSSSVTITLADPAGEYLLENPTTGLNTSTAYNGMYRYIGTTANNYVSLDGVLYRIIGVTSEANSTLGLQANQLKLIKAESIGTYNWHTDNTTNPNWESSAMYTYLQGSNVLSNTSIIPSGWSSKISSVKWYIGDVDTTTVPDASTVLGLEDDTVTTGSSKVGLMYMSDYYYANTAGGTTNCYSACSNWMTLGSNEWTMTRYGYYYDYNYIDGYFSSWCVSSSGNAKGSSGMNPTNAVRPVFYLSSSVTYVSGSGTSDDPIVLS